MRGDGYGQNSTGSLSGLAKAYNCDVSALAIANAATLGVLASKVTVTMSSVPYQTQANDTLNSLVNRFAEIQPAAEFNNLNLPLTANVDIHPAPYSPNAAASNALTVECLFARVTQLRRSPLNLQEGCARLLSLQ